MLGELLGFFAEVAGELGAFLLVLNHAGQLFLTEGDQGALHAAAAAVAAVVEGLYGCL